MTSKRCSNKDEWSHSWSSLGGGIKSGSSRQTAECRDRRQGHSSLPDGIMGPDQHQEDVFKMCISFTRFKRCLPPKRSILDWSIRVKLKTAQGGGLNLIPLVS